MPAGCTTFWTSMESRTASKHIPVLTPVEWPIVFRITCCHSLARTSVLKQIVFRQFLTRGEEMGGLRKMTLAALVFAFCSSVSQLGRTIPIFLTGTPSCHPRSELQTW